MTKKELVEKVFEENNFLKKDIDKITTKIFEKIIEGLVNDKKVMIKDFGTFEQVTQKAYTGVHPVTGEPMLIPETKKIRFKSSEKLKSIISSEK